MILVTSAEPGQSSGCHFNGYAERCWPSRYSGPAGISLRRNESGTNWFAIAALCHQECHGGRPRVAERITACPASLLSGAAEPAADLRGALTASRPISAAPAITTCGDEQA